jgi:hypothetical protein
MNFRLNAQMFVAYPKVQLAHYVDNTMPRRDWSQYDEPAYIRKARALNGERPPRKHVNRIPSVRSFAQAG